MRFQRNFSRNCTLQRQCCTRPFQVQFIAGNVKFCEGVIQRLVFARYSRPCITHAVIQKGSRRLKELPSIVI